jgi:hypothetical protein
MSALRLGLLVGLVFGAINLLFAWVLPLEDDSIGALLRFYGPMFLIWAYASFRATRRGQSVWSGVATGLLVAFATFCVFNVLNLIRVNVFLEELTGRAEWRSMMAPSGPSQFENVRAFVTLEYINDSPLKIAAASLTGAIVGALGGSLGRIAVASRSMNPASDA